MSDESLKTLFKCDKFKPSDRWYPQSVDKYKLTFHIDTALENVSVLRSNLAYNMQYIEFLEKEFSELALSSVIYIMLVKTYVITAMSILEGVFANIIKSNGWWKTSNLESLGVVQANEKNFSEKTYVVKTELLKKTDRHDVQMNFDEMIKILNRHHEVLNVDHLVYPSLKRLKELRNRIHLQKLENEKDHDYNSFDYKVKNEMRNILYTILTSTSVTSLPHIFEFLKINISESE